MMHNLISVKEFAARIGKSSQWVWFLIMTKKINAVKVGNQYVIDAEELNKLNYTQNKEAENES